MKKIVILCIAGILLTSGVSFATEMATAKSASPADFWVKLTITFHKPRFDCLRGFGLCFYLNWGWDSGTNPISEAACPVRMSWQNNQLFLEVTESALMNYENGSSLHYFKDKSTITLDESYEVPPDLSRQLGSSTTLVIQAGTYPVAFRNGVYTVTF